VALLPVHPCRIAGAVFLMQTGIPNMIDEDALKSIERLHQMNADGVISAEEFERSKERILFGAQKKPPFTASVAGQFAAPVGLPAADDYVSWAILPLKKYADFTGRSSRKEYWLFHLVFVALALGFAVLAVAASPEVAAVTLMVALLGLIVPLIAVQVRRFHDQGKSGWFAALNLIPYVGSFVVLVFMLFDGMPGPNAYGPDPKERQP
jgi:uncharacterized membrane protein YhaH (DUF805 family)